MVRVGHKLMLFANRKSHTDFKLVPKSLTLSYYEQPSGRHYMLFHTIRQI